jgi:hypothetical protein
MDVFSPIRSDNEVLPPESTKRTMHQKHRLILFIDCARRIIAPVGLIFIMLLLFSQNGFALSLKNIDALKGEFADSGIAAKIRQNEATLAALSATIPKTRDHDSLARILRLSLTGLRSSAKPDTGLKGKLASGLVLLCLGDLDLPKYYDTANALFSSMRRRFPEDATVKWMSGLSYVKSGEITRGISILDSLYLSGFRTDAFLADYAACVFHALVPEKVGEQSVFLKDLTTLLPDTSGPSAQAWSMVRVLAGQKIPCFIYGASFEIQRPPYLVFKRILAKDGWNLQLGSFPKAPHPTPAFEPFSPKTEAVQCKLFIDPAETDGPLFEYLSSRIAGKYDSIHVTGELKKQQGFTLRCYNIPRFLDDNGRYTAIATFDRPYIELQKHRKPKTGTLGLKKIRYTLVLQSSTEIQEVSEAKFQSILDAFFD